MQTDEIKFNTVLNDQGNPIAYDVTGLVTIDNEAVHLGFSCFYFDKAFNELCYWVKECPQAQIVYTTSTH
jgi:isopentenyldiphosphate isomerase